MKIQGMWRKMNEEKVDEYDSLYFLAMPWGKGYMVDSDTKHMLFK